jgi:hypothetical protein
MKLDKNDRSITFSVSLPLGVFEDMDAIRGDIPRSKYIQRLIEKELGR